MLALSLVLRDLMKAGFGLAPLAKVGSCHTFTGRISATVQPLSGVRVICGARGFREVFWPRLLRFCI